MVQKCQKSDLECARHHGKPSFILFILKKHLTPLTSAGLPPVGAVVVGVDGGLQVEAGVLQHPLDDLLQVHRLGHLRRRHHVERRQAGVGRVGHALDEVIEGPPVSVRSVVGLVRGERQGGW